MLLKLWWRVRTWLLPRDITAVDEGIYQGGAVDGMPLDVDAVLDLQLEHEDRLRPEGLRAFAWMPIEDGPPFPGVPWLAAAVATVEAWRQAKWAALIHCMEGRSRSGMVDVAYHMKVNSWGRDDALAYVRGKRPQTNPNAYFMAGLKEYEDFLVSGSGTAPLPK